MTSERLPIKAFIFDMDGVNGISRKSIDRPDDSAYTIKAVV